MYCKFKLYLNTIKYLKIKQLFYRVYYKYKKIKINSDQGLIFEWSWQGPYLNNKSIFSINEVCFLNKRLSDFNQKNWNDITEDKLWLYNLHYFDDLNSLDYDKREHLHYKYISSWIIHNPPCYGNGWEPYPLSLRLVNWIKWFSKKDHVDMKYIISLYQQSEALYKQIEYHILGNHLFSNAKALIFSGVYLNGKSSDKYLNKGLKILNCELKEQFLFDGAHFELSPMYHQILLWDLLELIDLVYTSKDHRLLEYLEYWKSIASKAISWLRSMLHPDGEISFFNDAAIGIAIPPHEIFKYAKKLSINDDYKISRLVTNYSSGYSNIKFDDYTVIFDHANVGPDYLPGHAHADSLSFEMSVGQQRLFVNSGTSLYGISDERLRQRKTAAHNTVEINGCDSSEVWSGFRVARRAYSTLNKSLFDEINQNVVISASHDGYRRVDKNIIHSRTLTCSFDQVTIEDTFGKVVGGTFTLHLHPNVEVIKRSNRILILKINDFLNVEFSSSDDIKIESSTWHPRFGESVDNNKIIINFNKNKISSFIKILKD
ncbi:heparinase [Photobacterium kishitanii]|uniref:heparinase II/III family protein n=1 Tax=Photobacterium kishitanii TaxID=318456 RepID=UPI000D16AB09|nr:heparinase II/III family protein [Photobacterium kishitanii]PSU95376.1 heparinase [Photobacterium kishitanii]